MERGWVMERYFNISADCRPNVHYMADIQGRLSALKSMMERGEYITINRARQYGKTTLLKALGPYLGDDYAVLSLDFQKLSHKDFKTEELFVKALAREIMKKPVFQKEVPEDAAAGFGQLAAGTGENMGLADLFELFSIWCGESGRPVIFLVDEADSAANYEVFLDFLAMLRAGYIDRDESPAFQSVILAGVYDVKNLKRKNGGGERHRANSPWNIAADFLVYMSFSADEIAGMLKEYEKDCHTGMDVYGIAGMIYDYTSGYPFLVSCLCKLADERITGNAGSSPKRAWTREDILEAVRLMLSEQNTLFDSLIHKLEDYPELEVMLKDLLFRGKEILYVVGLRCVETALMFGFVKKEENRIVIANRIFETLLYNLFLASHDMCQNRLYDAALMEKNQFIRNGHLDMKLVLEKFIIHFDDLYGDRPQDFAEEDGRKYFLLYLRPIINGVGNYYIESQTRNMERTDVIVDYLGEQFIIELKIWRGNAYHERGEKQLADYLDYYHLKKGYMLSFNFNKNKQAGIKEIWFGNRLLIEAVV